MSDLVWESIRGIVLTGICAILWRAGRKQGELINRGWRLVLGGFGLLLFASLLDISDNFASLNQEKYSPSFLWHGDNILPGDTWALMPKMYHAFIAENEIVVAHGGATIEEVVVPFVKIEKTHE